MNINDYKDVILAGAVVVAGAIGAYLLLPHRHGLTKPAAARWIGGVLGALAIALILLFFTPPGTFLRTVFFYAFAILSLAGAGLTITSRDPVASALWFASVILATSGLFLLAGAQFLAAGTVIVYAGAIIVTFLFVIMLASKQGCALYDRSARSPARATFTCFLLFFGLMYTLLIAKGDVSFGGLKTPFRGAITARDITPTTFGPPNKFGTAIHVFEKAIPQTSRLAPSQVVPAAGASASGVPPKHVAGLGGSLYADNLIAIEAVGVLLFVALVGAVAIAAPKPPARIGASAGRSTK